jgi:hypothetical protein
MKAISRFVIILCTGLLSAGAASGKSRSSVTIDTGVIVPLGGNAWRTDKDTTGGEITEKGISNWSNASAEFTAFVRFGRTGKIRISLVLAVPAGKSVLAISITGAEKILAVKGTGQADFYAGEWTIRDTGYVAIKMRGISKTGTVFADLQGLKISGDAVDSRTAFVKNNDGDFFYWGRRGPSVHLSYQLPQGKNVEWFYNEVTVPAGQDVLHSYFMACGFAEGYFGMQVNSPTERHILFSVWSPFNTDDPKKIPEEEKINMLKKGDGVHTGEFGSEGSGGQSYLLYNWKAGNTYRFLVQAHPAENGYTTYTAWFFAPEVGYWQLIASFNRPKTVTYLTHLHSFLENFEPEQGSTARRVHFNNEWIADENGSWTELTRARFTVDNTGAKGYRMDYAGGVEDGSFFLKNCGFFNEYTPRNSFFDRPATQEKPKVDLGRLP